MNFSSKMEELSVETLLEKSESLKKRPEDEQQLTSYDDMLEFTARNKKNLNRVTLVGLAHMVYGWMPTMIRHTSFKDDAKDWNECIKRGCLEEAFVERVSRLTNNSVVGASKLLHFLNPQKYPIFDSKVYNSIVDDKGSGKDISKKIRDYICYAKKIRDLVNDSREKSKIEKIKNNLIEKGYLQKGSDPSPIRVLELVLYVSGD